MTFLVVLHLTFYSYIPVFLFLHGSSLYKQLFITIHFRSSLHILRVKASPGYWAADCPSRCQRDQCVDTVRPQLTDSLNRQRGCRSTVYDLLMQRSALIYEK